MEIPLWRNRLELTNRQEHSKSLYSIYFCFTLFISRSINPHGQGTHAQYPNLLNPFLDYGFLFFPKQAERKSIKFQGARGLEWFAGRPAIENCEGEVGVGGEQKGKSLDP